MASLAIILRNGTILWVYFSCADFSFECYLARKRSQQLNVLIYGIVPYNAASAALSLEGQCNLKKFSMDHFSSHEAAETSTTAP